MKTFSLTKTSFLATIPILLFGISWIFEFIEVNRTVYYSSLLISIASMFFLFGLGWVKNFPKWTTHSIGFCLLLSIYFMTISIPKLFGGEVLGIYGLLPITFTILVSIAFNFSLEPLRQLYSKMKTDKSLLIFIFYGFLPVLLMFQFDEVHSIKLVPITIILTILTALGVLIYLNSTRNNFRAMTLISGIILTNTIAMVVTTLI
jgi:hypothetical protein